MLSKNLYNGKSTEGTHCGLPGYGTRDYLQYAKEFRVKFPFDAFIHFTSQGDDELTFIREGVWLSLQSYKNYLKQDNYTFQVLVPVWEEERKLGNVQAEVIAINADESAPNPEYSANQNKEQLYAGGTDWTDSVVYTQLVRTYGRVYDMRITDIGDYPLWEDHSFVPLCQ